MAILDNDSNVKIEDLEFAKNKQDNDASSLVDLPIAVKQAGVSSGGSWGRQQLNWLFKKIYYAIKKLNERALDKNKNLGDLLNASTARVHLGLGTAATKNVGESVGQVMQVGSFGIQPKPPQTSNHFIESLNVWTDNGAQGVHNRPSGYGYGAGISIPYDSENTTSLSFSMHGRIFYSTYVFGVITSRELLHTGNILPTTGNLTDFPMSQKAVTDQLDTKASTTYVDQQIATRETPSGAQTKVNTHANDKSNPHAVTKAQVGLGNVPNWSQATFDDRYDAKGTASGLAIGVGQTWQDVTGSRILGKTYTNTTDKAITVIQVSEYFNGLDELYVDVDGLLIIRVDQGIGTDWTGAVTFIVPSGSTYTISKPVSPNIKSWVELRS